MVIVAGRFRGVPHNNKVHVQVNFDRIVSFGEKVFVCPRNADLSCIRIPSHIKLTTTSVPYCTSTTMLQESSLEQLEPSGRQLQGCNIFGSIVSEPGRLCNIKAKPYRERSEGKANRLYCRGTSLHTTGSNTERSPAWFAGQFPLCSYFAYSAYNTHGRAVLRRRSSQRCRDIHVVSNDRGRIPTPFVHPRAVDYSVAALPTGVVINLVRSLSQNNFETLPGGIFEGLTTLREL